MEGKGVKPIGGMPAGGHVEPVCVAVLGRCLAVISDKSLKHVDKDNVQLTETMLLEGGVYL